MISVSLLAVVLVVSVPVAYLSYAFIRGFVIETHRLRRPGPSRTVDERRDEY